MTSEPSRRISSFRRPTALSSLSPRNELLQTSSARRSVLCTAVGRTGRISWSVTGTPREAACQAASHPARPPPMMRIMTARRPSRARFGLRRRDRPRRLAPSHVAFFARRRRSAAFFSTRAGRRGRARTRSRAERRASSSSFACLERQRRRVRPLRHRGVGLAVGDVGTVAAVEHLERRALRPRRSRRSPSSPPAGAATSSARRTAPARARDRP